MSFCSDLYSGYYMELTEKNLSQQPPTAAEIVQKGVKQAARLFHEGNLSACQLLVSQLLRVDKDNDEALQIAGLLKLRIGEGQAAIPLLEAARAINPENPDHHNNLALAYSRVGRYDEAIKCLDTATMMAPGRQVFWVNYSVQLRNKANQDLANREAYLDKAHSFLFKAIELNPTASAHANCMRDFPSPVSAKIAARPRRIAHSTIACWKSNRCSFRSPGLWPVATSARRFPAINDS